MPISMVGGFAEPIASKKRSVGDARPEASTTRSAASLPGVPRVSSKRTPATPRLSGEAISSVTPERSLNSMFGSRSTRRRQDTLQRGARQGELIESEIALRKMTETRNLESHVAAHAHSNGAGLDEIELDAWKQRLERTAAAREEIMRMSRLRCPRALRGLVRQCVAVEHNDLFEMGRDGFRRGEASNSGADNDGLLQNRI